MNVASQSLRFGKATLKGPRPRKEPKDKSWLPNPKHLLGLVLPLALQDTNGLARQNDLWSVHSVLILKGVSEGLYKLSLQEK